MYDYHLHSTNSPDGRLTVNETCEILIDKGFKEIAFTDHVDFDCPGRPDPVLDYERYSREIDQAREIFAGKLEIVKGLEIGLQPKAIPKSIDFVTNHQFDFIIGSVHYVDGLELFNGDFCAGKQREEAYRLYLEAVDRVVESFPYFHVLGHLDVVRRYAGFADRRISIKEFPQLLDRILIKLVESGRGIEVNSSGFRFQLEDTLPSLDVVKRYRELGGQIITVGSDAHRRDAVGYKIEEAYGVVQAVGFNHISLFREGRPINVVLPRWQNTSLFEGGLPAEGIISRR